MEYSFNELSRDLDIGHEIEFTYTTRKFSITNTGSGWVLTEFYKQDDQVFSTAQGLLHHGTIDGILLKKIWPMVHVDTIF